MTASTHRPPVVPAGPHLAARARRQREERRARRLRRVRRTALVLLPVALIAWVLLASPLLALRDVQVEGAQRLTRQQIAGAADVAPGVPLARVDTDAVARRVGRLSPVADVEVTRRWPHTLAVRVTERVAVAATPQPDGSWRLVDATGQVFSAVAELPPDLARLQLTEGGAAADPAARVAIDVLVQLPPALRSAVREVQAPSPTQVTLLLRDGRTVVWGAPDQAERKAAVVEALLRRPGRTIDVTAPSVAVVR